MENRIYNFAAGPSMLADEVLIRIKEELFSYNNTGMSVMEMSHRSKVYLEIFEKTKESLNFDEVSCGGLVPNKISHLTHPLWNEEQLPTIAYSGNHVEHMSHNVFQLLRGVFESTEKYTSTHISASAPTPTPTSTTASAHASSPSITGGLVVDDEDIS